MRVDLTPEQARLVTIDYLADHLVTMKQYYDESQIAKNKFVIQQFATLLELDQIIQKFDRTWPNSLKWDDC